MINTDELDLSEKLININRVAKVVAGGRRFGFSALVVVGDGNGHVGFGHAKAKEVPEAIRKAGEQARKSLIFVPRRKGTLFYTVTGKQDATQVLLKPASEGTGVIAGSTVRAVMEAAGIHDVLTKSLGSRNPLNMVRAAFEGMSRLESPEQISTRRGKKKD